LKKARKPRRIGIVGEDAVVPVVLGPGIAPCLNEVAKRLRASPEEILRVRWIVALIGGNSDKVTDSFRNELWRYRDRLTFPSKHVCEKIDGDWSWMDRGMVLAEAPDPADDWKKN
jgi:hypothetical protein